MSLKVTYLLADRKKTYVFQKNFYLILSFRRVLYVIYFLLGNSPASKF